ncbi:MAG: hypothetical protein ACYSTY_08640 [Planctomycetota bacterium]
MMKNGFACWAAAACMSLGCLALSGCTTTQAQADADDVVTAGALPKSTCTKDKAKCAAKGDAAVCCPGGLKDSPDCHKNKKADSDTE